MSKINKDIINLFLIAFVIAFLNLNFLNEADSATITIVNGDSPGEGLNETTPFGGAPGNPATTVGQARINSFNYAAQILGDALVSDVEIEVLARFDSLFCSAFSATLGQAGPRTGHINFTNAPIPNTVYPQALANSYAGFDLSGLEDIQATFNSELDGSLSCLGGTEWYYGTDANPPSGTIDFVTTAIHEIIHGLGFSSNILSSGAFFGGNVAIYDRFLINSSLTPLDTATNSTRQAAILSGNGLLWDGPSVNSIVSQKTNGTRSIGGSEYIQMYAPSPYESGSSTSHYDTEVSPDEIMEPILVVDEHDLTFSLALLEDMGWFLNSSPPPPPPPPGGTGPFMESGGQVVMEAENFDENNAGSTDTWSSNSSSGASGGTYMQSVPNNGNNFNTGYAANSPELMYLVDFTTTGTYYVWVRACGPSGHDDSLHAGIDGLENTTSNRIRTANSCSSFQWTKTRSGGAPDASINVGTAEVHEINIWMREDGNRIDKILLTTNSSFTPTGTGPAESPKEGDPPPPPPPPPPPDPEGTNPGECEDSIDNDGDTQIDCDDSGCTADPACLPPTGPFLESGGLVVFEAENFDENNAGTTDTWSSNSSSGASGGTYMRSVPNNGNNFNTGYAANSPEMMYLVDFINVGTYYVWVRACGPSGRDDSLHAGIDGLENTTSNRIRTANSCSSFQWTKTRSGGAPDASVNVGTAGVHEINIWMREDGNRVDKILLTTDSGFTPTGEGPAESPRGS